MANIKKADLEFQKRKKGNSDRNVVSYFNSINLLSEKGADVKFL